MMIKRKSKNQEEDKVKNEEEKVENEEEKVEIEEEKSIENSEGLESKKD